MSDCSGRVGKIMDSVKDLFNETSEAFLSDEFILRSINRCLQRTLRRRTTGVRRPRPRHFQASPKWT